MTKFKEFMKSPKKTVILGLIGSIFMLANLLIYFDTYSILEELRSIGLIIYFATILVRLFFRKGSLKFANYALITSYLVALLIVIPNIRYLNFVSLVYIFSLVIVLLYFCNILLRKNNFVNNKIFAIVIIIYTLIQLIRLFITKYLTFTDKTIYSINYIGYLLVIPYFYNYYNILNGGK